jgi:hypothetical protein
MDRKEKTRWFKSERVNTPDLQKNVDATKGILTDVVLCQEGESKGHGTHLEKSFIQDIVNLAEGRKIKSRFGHPNMSNEALGTYLGNFENVRYRENEKGIGQAIGDLHLAQSSKVSPSGDLWNYVTKAASEHPEFFGSSIVFRPGENYYYNSKGKKVLSDYYTAKEAEDNETGKVYETITELLATDLVDEGAATDSLFSAASFFNSESFAVKATQFLNENPQIFEFLEQNPQKIEPFIETYLKNKSKKSAMKTTDINKKSSFDQFKEFGQKLFGTSFSASVSETSETETTEKEEEKPEEEAKKSDAENVQLASIQEAIVKLQERNEQLEKFNAVLETRISELSAQPAAEPTVPTTSEETQKSSKNSYNRIAEFHAQTKLIHK